MAYELYIYDLDGTLLDTSPGILEAMEKAREELALPELTAEQAKRFIGPPVIEAAHEYYGMDEAEAIAYHNVYERYYTGGLMYHSVVYPLIPEGLDALRAAGKLTAVATAKFEVSARSVLERSGLMPRFDNFSAVIGMEQGKCGIIRRALDALGVPPSRAVMIGDSVYDASGAREAGVDFVAAAYGFGFYEEGSLTREPSVAVARTPRELYDWLLADI